MLSALFGSITEDVYENAKAYLLITAFSIPGIGIYEAGAAIFRTMGNALFIYGFSMGSRGAADIAANAVTQTIASIQVIPGSAIQLGIGTVVLRCIGAGDSGQAAYYNRKLLKFTYIALAMLDIPIFLGLPWILRLYHLSPDTARLTTEMVFWHTLGAVTVWPLTFDLPASIRAVGDVRFAMVTSIVSM